MTVLPFVAVSVLLAVALRIVWVKLRDARRADFIRSHAFPKGLIQKLQLRRPELAAKDGQLAARALRQFFLAYLKSGRQFVAMPSQVADDLWHEFILYTRHYDAFCKQAFGAFLHHTPAVALAQDKHDNAGLRRVWWHCCKEENINPAKPTRLGCCSRSMPSSAFRTASTTCPTAARCARRKGATNRATAAATVQCIAAATSAAPRSTAAPTASGTGTAATVAPMGAMVMAGATAAAAAAAIDGAPGPRPADG